VIKPYVPTWERPSQVCFRMRCIATPHDRVDTLPRSLTNELSPHVHVSCPPGFELFYVRSEVLRLPNLHVAINPVMTGLHAALHFVSLHEHDLTCSGSAF